MNMFKAWGNLKIGVRLIIGFLIVIILGGVVGVVGINATSNIQNANNQLVEAKNLYQTLLEARRAEKNWIMRGGDTYFQEVKTKVQKLRKFHKALA